MSIKFSGNFKRTNRAIKKALNPISVEVAKQSNKYVKKDPAVKLFNKMNKSLSK